MGKQTLNNTLQSRTLAYKLPFKQGCCAEWFLKCCNALRERLRIVKILTICGYVSVYRRGFSVYSSTCRRVQICL